MSRRRPAPRSEAFTDAKLAGMTDFSPGGPLGDRLGITVHELSAATVRASMPVAGNTQPFGALHGGASAVLAETVGSVGAVVHAGQGRYAVGMELNITHHRPVTSGSVHATAAAAHLGRTTASYTIEVVDDAGRRTASARLLCMLLDRPH